MVWGLRLPDCSPPMTVVFSDIAVTDTTSNISCTL